MDAERILEILDFINTFKERHPQEIEDVFSNGFCYWFAKILELRFGGTIFFNPESIHFATLINDYLFDIYGIIDADECWIDWEDYVLTHDIDGIYHSCILKTT
jgi:hypothetical protein